jgi:hypothetical protein
MLHPLCHQTSYIHRPHAFVVSLRASLINTSHITLTSTCTIAQSRGHYLYIAFVLKHFSTHNVVIIKFDLIPFVSSSKLGPNTFHFMQSTHRPHNTILMLNNCQISSSIESCQLIYNFVHRGTNRIYKTSMYIIHLTCRLLDHNRRLILSYRDHQGAETLNTISTHSNYLNVS